MEVRQEEAAAGRSLRHAVEPLLEVDRVAIRFGGIVALDGVSFDVPENRIVGLIGPNGAGKTTLFNCLSRLYQVEAGAIEFDGRSLLAAPRHGIARLGIGRTFQNLALFRTMSVLENVMIGHHCRSRSGFLVNALRLPWVAHEEQMPSSRYCSSAASMPARILGQPARSCSRICDIRCCRSALGSAAR